jgi:hypothetical protein
MRRYAVALLLLGLVHSAALAEVPCPIDQAQYRMMHNEAWSAGFRTIPKHREWLSDLAFFVHSEQVEKDFWFVFDQGNGVHVDIYLYSTADVTKPGWKPEDDGPLSGYMRYFAADDDLVFTTEAPTRDDPAPTYILTPELMQSMWYGPYLSAPLDMFKFVGCIR